MHIFWRAFPYLAHLLLILFLCVHCLCVFLCYLSYLPCPSFLFFSPFFLAWVRTVRGPIFHTPGVDRKHHYSPPLPLHKKSDPWSGFLRAQIWPVRTPFCLLSCFMTIYILHSTLAITSWKLKMPGHVLGVPVLHLVYLYRGGSRYLGF
ncbi:hypothetical protein BJY00DRAFT_179195 [Aspergillus carlsbadensis]|nr:hypothetical protein BJY00DRAFT_179195 [Aspergillus carlsbadensis]